MTLVFIVLALIAIALFSFFTNLSPQAAVGDTATVSLVKGIVVYPKTGTNPANMQVSLNRVVNGTATPVTLPAGSSLSLMADPARTINVTTTQDYRFVNSTGALPLQKGVLYELVATHSTTTCLTRFRVPATTSANAFTLTDASLVATTEVGIDRITLPCSTTTPSPVPSLPVVDAGLPEICSKPKLDVLFVADNSGTMNQVEAPINHLREFFKESKHQFQASDRVGLVRYSYDGDGSYVSNSLTPITLPLPSGDTQPEAIQKILNLLNTNAPQSFPAPGLRKAELVFENSDESPATVTQVAVLFIEDATDLNSGQFDVMKEIVDRMYARGVFTYAVPLSTYPANSPLLTRLEELTRRGGGKVVQMAAQTDAKAATEAVFKHINGQFDNCIKVTASTDKVFARDDNEVTVTYTIKNFSRSVLQGTLTQPLPTGLVTSTGGTNVSIPLSPLARGGQQTYDVKVTVNR